MHHKFLRFLGGPIFLALTQIFVAPVALADSCNGSVCTVTVANDLGTAPDGATGGFGTLSYALAYANAQASAVTINIQSGLSITLGGPLSPIFNSVTINGNGATISGANQNRIFMVGVDTATQTSLSIASQNVALNNLTLANGFAKGGDGGAGGGGGMGAGGALFVNQSANVTLTNVGFVRNAAQGGTAAYASGNFAIGGGGGLGGNGSASGGGGGIFGTSTSSAGAGLFGNAASGLGGGGYSGNAVDQSAGVAGKLQISFVGGSGGGVSTGSNPYTDRILAYGGAGGGSGASYQGTGGGGGFGNLPSWQIGRNFGSGISGGSGGFGGGGGTAVYQGLSGFGGFGGFGGGGAGGGSFLSIQTFGAAGGFGGGGGNSGGGGFGGGAGAGTFGNLNGGGFGGGAGAAAFGSFVSGGSVFGGGKGSFSQGGGGAAMGGAVFVVKGGTLIVNGDGAMVGSSVVGGLGGGDGAGNGSAYGAGFFVEGSALTFGSGNYRIADAIADLNGSAGNATTPDGLGGTGGQSSIVKSGSGVLTIGGANTYTGPTIVSAGALNVSGSIASSSLTTVSGGGVLTGTGVVGATQVDARGVFAPGSGAPGSTMNVAGNLNFGAGGLYLVGIGAGGASSANVSGAATLTGGGVQTVLAAGGPLPRASTILTATGGLGGTQFSGVSASTLPGLSQSLVYTPTKVQLVLTATLGANNGGTNLPANAFGVGNAINVYFNSGGTLPPQFAQLFGLSGSSLQSTLASLSGEGTTGGQTLLFQAGGSFLNAMLDPSGRGGGVEGGAFAPALAYAAETPRPKDFLSLADDGNSLKKAAAFSALTSPRWNVWAMGFGGYGRLGGDTTGTGSSNVSSSVTGIASGFDYLFSPETLLGVAFAGGGANWTLTRASGSGSSDFFQAGVYGSTRFGPAYLSTAVAFGSHWTTTNRVAAFGDQLQGRFVARTYSARLEGGYRIATPIGGLTPYTAVQAQKLNQPGFAEADLSFGGFGLNYMGRRANDTRVEIGGRYDTVLPLGAMTLALKARAAFAHDWVAAPAFFAQFQSLPGAGFSTTGAPPTKNAALLSVGAEVRAENGFALFGNFDSELSARARSYFGSGGVKYRW